MMGRRQQTILFMFLIAGSLDFAWCAAVPESVVSEMATVDPELFPVVQPRVTSTAPLEPEIQEDQTTANLPPMPVVMVTQREITPEKQTSTAIPNELLTKSSRIEPLPTSVADTKPPSLPEELPTVQPDVLDDVILDGNQTWHDGAPKTGISEGEPRYWPYYGGWFGYSPLLLGGGGGGGGGGGLFGGGGGGGGGGRK